MLGKGLETGGADGVLGMDAVVVSEDGAAGGGSVVEWCGRTAMSGGLFFWILLAGICLGSFCGV